VLGGGPQAAADLPPAGHAPGAHPRHGPRLIRPPLRAGAATTSAAAQRPRSCLGCLAALQQRRQSPHGGHGPARGHPFTTGPRPGTSLQPAPSTASVPATRPGRFCLSVLRFPFPVLPFHAFQRLVCRWPRPTRRSLFTPGPPPKHAARRLYGMIPRGRAVALPSLALPAPCPAAAQAHSTRLCRLCRLKQKSPRSIAWQGI
jgi:hypothetical protein